MGSREREAVRKGLSERTEGRGAVKVKRNEYE